VFLNQWDASHWCNLIIVRVRRGTLKIATFLHISTGFSLKLHYNCTFTISVCSQPVSSEQELVYRARRCLCDLYNEAVTKTNYVMSNEQMMVKMNRNGCGRKLSWFNPGTILIFALKKTKNLPQIRCNRNVISRTVRWIEKQFASYRNCHKNLWTSVPFTYFEFESDQTWIIFY
jgi:hypothetical protein